MPLTVTPATAATAVNTAGSSVAPLVDSFDAVVELLGARERRERRSAEAARQDLVDEDGVLRAGREAAQRVAAGKRRRLAVVRREVARQRRHGVVERIQHVARDDVDPRELRRAVRGEDRAADRPRRREERRRGIERREPRDVVRVRRRGPGNRRRSRTGTSSRSARSTPAAPNVLFGEGPLWSPMNTWPLTAVCARFW